MKLLLRSLIILCMCVVFPSKFSVAQEIKPIIHGDFADPSILRNGTDYYATGTSSEWAPHFPIFKSTNLRDWKQTGYVFSVAPAWTVASFWAPEYYFHNKTYFIYYTARRKSDSISCIGVATSKFPDRDFKDHGVIIEYGKEAIDAFVYNDNGQLYITWKAYGLDGRPIEILGSKLSDNGLILEGETFSLLKDEKGIGLEGQSILKKDDYYYLFYSAGNCCGSNCDYNVRIARAKSLKGPYLNYEKNPVLQGNAEWKCSGHGTFVNSPDGRYYYIYHSYNKQSSVFTGRQGMLAELIWPEKNGWPVFKDNAAAHIQTEIASSNDIKADFSENKPGNFWQWDFRSSGIIAEQKKGNLHLSGTINSGNNAGVALTIRPVLPDYEMTTEVQNNNGAQKGLIIYGDANAAIGLATINDQVEFWMVKDNKRTLLGNAVLGNSKAPVQLKMVVRSLDGCTAFWRQQDGSWKELTASQGKVPLDFLPPWDRSPRPGLNFKGIITEEGVFSDFKLSYLAK